MSDASRIHMHNPNRMVQPKFVPSGTGRVTIPEVIHAFVDFYKKFEGWAPDFHCTLEDGNHEKMHWDDAIKDAMMSRDPVVVELAHVMSYLTITQRLRAADLAEYLACGATPPTKRERTAERMERRRLNAARAVPLNLASVQTIPDSYPQVS